MRAVATLFVAFFCAMPVYASVSLTGAHVGLTCEEEDIPVLRERLAYAPLGIDSVVREGTPTQRLMAELDALYVRVSQIIDLAVPEGFVYVTVVSDRAAVGTEAETVMGERHDAAAVYVHERQTIYVAAEEFTRPVLSHEFSHAVMGSFFVVPPPEKMQEVLSGYAEYMLTKEDKSGGQ